jgi:excisionase family DNA binding protein
MRQLKMHAPALTLKDFCDAYRVCRETAYQQIRAGRLRAVKLGRKTLILRADASLPELRTVGREQASA